jgi:hypothetical protein
METFRQFFSSERIVGRQEVSKLPDQGGEQLPACQSLGKKHSFDSRTKRVTHARADGTLLLRIGKNYDKPLIMCLQRSVQ